MATMIVVHPSATKKGRWEIHKNGCADLKKVNRYDCYEVEAESLKDIVMDTFGPEAGSFFEEAGLDPHDPTAWKHYVGEFRVLPCVGRLPEE